MITNSQHGVQRSRMLNMMPVAAAPARRLARLGRWLTAARARHARRSRLRRELPLLDERLARDMGSTLAALRREAYRPFWRD